MRVILASASPRRAALLRAAGVEFEVRAAHVDESLEAGEPPETYARRVAEAKARAVGPHATAAVVAADTVVVVDGMVLGKPMDQADAGRMLRLLSGRTHEVLTAVAVIPPGSSRGHAVVAVDRTRVAFRPLTDEEIDAYVATGEPADKAGAYAVQGGAAGFVSRLEGSYANVVGLPLTLVYEMLRGVADPRRDRPFRCPGGPVAGSPRSKIAARSN
jgi:septum formation protein